MDPDLRPLLERLAFKYRSLAELRARREQVEGEGLTGFDALEGSQRRTRFHALAAEFPGALRELDVGSAAALRWKAMSIELSLGDLAAGRPMSSGDQWMIWTIDYHSILREALSVKRWLAGRPNPASDVDEATIEAFRVWKEGVQVTEPDRQQIRTLLESHLHPPRGRIQALVWQLLAEKHQRPAADLEQILFGSHLQR